MSAIRLGGMYGVGSVELIENRVTGEGGPHDPRLVLPLQVRMEPASTDRMLALTQLTCSLHLVVLGTATHPGNQHGPSTTTDLSSGLHCRSLASVGEGYIFDVRIPLAQPHVAKLEAWRHSTGGKDFTGTLHLSGKVAWVYQTGGSMSSLMKPLDASKLDGELFPPGAGMYSTFAYFWDTRMDDLPLHVPESTWIENVLPGLGLDRLRLVELALPTIGGLLELETVQTFDAARREYDSGRYRECIEKCRYVRDGIHECLGATRERPVAKVIGDRLHMASNAPQRAFLRDAWKSLVDLTNAAHHPTQARLLMPSDARACLLVVAVLLEYLQALAGTMPLGAASAKTQP